MTLPETLTEGEVRIIQEALEGRPTWSELARALEAQAKSQESEGLRMLSLAFVYDLIDPAQDGRRATAGGPYATMFESEEGAFPPRPADVVAEVRVIWRSARDAVEDPIVGARIADLLYVAEGKSAYPEGRAGARELLRLAGLSEWRSIDRAVCLSRAMEVMAELNDRDALQAAVQAAVALTDEMLRQEHPGPPFIVLRALIALKSTQRPDNLDDLLDRVIERFDGSPDCEEPLALAARATSDAQRRRDLRYRQLQLRIGEVETSQGLGRVWALQRAIELARRYGFTTEAAELLKQQQDVPKEELGFESATSSVEVPKDAVRAQVDLIVGSHAADLFDALGRLGKFGPPGGSSEDIDREVKQAGDFAFLGLIGQSTIGPASSVPNFIANDPESKRLLGRGQRRRMQASFFGSVLIAPMLDEAVVHHGRASRGQLAEYFSTKLIGPERGERIARALELFWDQHYDDSAHVIVPRLEAILRDLARHGGITIAKPAYEGRFAGAVSLNVVMAKLRELYDDTPWLCYLDALLCDPHAMNLRNDIAHGLVGCVDGAAAALLIHVACYLALLEGQTDAAATMSE